MIKGTTESGYKYSIDENVLADWRVIKKLAKLRELEDADEESALDFILIMSDIEEIIFKDGGKAFEKAILKKNDGVIAPAIALQEILGIFQNAKQLKNS